MENKSIDLCQKMKQPANYSMFYGPLDIKATGNQFTLINPANGGKVCSDKDLDDAHKRSESTNLLTFEDIARMSLSSCYWEWIISSSTTMKINPYSKMASPELDAFSSKRKPIRMNVKGYEYITKPSKNLLNLSWKY